MTATPQFAPLTAADVETLHSALAAVTHSRHVRIYRASTGAVTAGTARSVHSVTPGADLRDHDLIVNDGFCDVHIPVREVLAAAALGGFDSGRPSRTPQ